MEQFILDSIRKIAVEGSQSVAETRHSNLSTIIDFILILQQIRQFNAGVLTEHGVKSLVKISKIHIVDLHILFHIYEFVHLILENRKQNLIIVGHVQTFFHQSYLHHYVERGWVNNFFTVSHKGLNRTCCGLDAKMENQRNSTYEKDKNQVIN